MCTQKQILGLTLSFLFLFQLSLAQTDKTLLRELAEQEQEAVNALILYPEESREIILEATKYPEALIKMESIQRKSSSDFEELMKRHPMDVQKALWDMTRYPQLIAQLARGSEWSNREMDNILQAYPEAIHERARHTYARHFSLLQEVDQMDQAARTALTSVMRSYPTPAQEVLKSLIELPEVLSLLTENIRLTILVGDIYQREPEWILAKADSMHLVLARQQAAELEDWKKTVEEDPKMQEQLEASAQNYEEEYGYDNEDYFDQYPPEDDEPEVIVQHYYYHYPYWFGVPYWYNYPRWRPAPLWYEWGFYLPPSGPVVVIGLPSYHFVHWYFYHPYNYYHWPYLSSHFVHHYHHHHHVHSSIYSGVSHWRQSHRTVISDRWLRQDGKLDQRFKEFGKFEMDRQRYNAKNPRKPLSPEAYLEKKGRKYPKTKASRKQVALRDKESNNRLKKTDSVRKPTLDAKQPSKRDVFKKQQPTTPKKEATKKPPRKAPQINKAEKYHRDKWEKQRKPKVTKPNLSKKKPTIKRPKKKPTLKRPKRTTPKKPTKVPRKKGGGGSE